MREHDWEVGETVAAKGRHAYGSAEDDHDAATSAAVGMSAEGDFSRDSAQQDFDAFLASGVAAGDSTGRSVSEPRKRHRGWRIAAIVLAAVLVVAAASAGVVGLFLRNTISSMHTIGDPFAEITSRPSSATTSGEADGSDSPINFLIMGSDSRISAGDPNDWEYGAQRTDALMLVQISADRQHIAVMSIPRDSWVDIPGNGTAKINAAFSYGGPSLTIQTVEQLTGVRIDHIALVDFTTFTELTDLVGGVTIDTADGAQHFDGTEALAYVRERYSLPRGDFDRVRRQQAWMKAVLSEILTTETLSSPSKLMGIAETMSEYVAVDDGLGVNDIVSIGSSLRGFDQNNLIFFTAPVSGTGTSEDGQSIVNLNMERLEQVSKAFQQDDVAAFMKVNGKNFDTLSGRPVD